jgi:energy-coupling factor transporter ATP-binding protein EcfA2
MRKNQLQLVKNLSQLNEERKFADETAFESNGLIFSRGCLNEIVGSDGAGKSSIVRSLLGKLTNNGEVCALIDTANSFDPNTAKLGGILLENLLWTRCSGEVVKAFTSADYLIQAKGFGAIWLNLNHISAKDLRAVPRSYWYRFRTKVRDTPTIFVVTVNNESIAESAATVSYQLERSRTIWSGIGRFKLLREFHLRINSRKQFAETVFSRVECSYEDV